MNDDFDDVFGLLFFFGPTISMMFLDFTLMLLLSWSVFRLTADDFFFFGPMMLMISISTLDEDDVVMLLAEL